MWIDNALDSVATAQYALQTLATVWSLTGCKYPPPAVVNDGDQFDYIVAGGGSAGSVVATRLSEDPNVSVLLIEAGGDPPLESDLPGGATFLQNSHLDWDMHQHSQVDEDGYQCLRDKRQPVSHGKMLGGGSSINLMMYMRGHPHDYDRWADITGDPSWKYENVLPHFEKSENLVDERTLESPAAKYHGKHGPLGVSRLWSDASKKYIKIYKEMGYHYVYDLNSNASLGFNEQMVTVAGGRRQSTANAHLQYAKERTNLHVLRFSHVSKVIIDKNKVARGVEFIDKNNQTVTVKANKEVILSAGPINSPHILLLSGVGPKDQLEKFGIECLSDLPVGQQLINHHGIFLPFKVDKVNPPPEPQRPADPSEFPCPIITGVRTLNKNQSYPDYLAATVVMDAPALALTFLAVLFAFNREISQIMYDETKGHEVLFAAIAEFNQQSRGTVSLKSTDPLDSPDIYIVAYPDEASYQRVVDYAYDFARIVNTTHFKEVGGELVTLPQCAHIDKSTREYIECFGRCMSSTYYHYCATNAMGKVTDSRLRVKNIDRLRVIDSSIMPTITSGTTNAPTIMIGEKGAAMIIEDNKGK